MNRDRGVVEILHSMNFKLEDRSTACRGSALRNPPIEISLLETRFGRVGSETDSTNPRGDGFRIAGTKERRIREYQLLSITSGD